MKTRFLTVLAVLTLLTMLGWHELRSAPKPSLCVAVLPTVFETQQGTSISDDRMLQLAGDSARIGIIRAIWATEEAYPLDDVEVIAVGSNDPARVMSAIAADEVIDVKISRDQFGFHLRLARLNSDGLVWSNSASSPTHLGITGAAVELIRAAYKDRDFGVPRQPPVAHADYVEYLDVRKTLADEPQRLVLADVVDQLEEICYRSPELYGAHSLLAGVACQMYDQTGDKEYLARAKAALDVLEEKIPNDPIYLRAKISLKFRENDWSAAEHAIGELERLAPGLPYLVRYKARLAKDRGDGELALKLYAEAVDKRRSWDNLWALGGAELEVGNHESAVTHLEEALSLVPGRIELKAKLAEAALYACQLDKAKDLLTEVCGYDVEPRPRYVSDFATVFLLRGDYVEALHWYTIMVDGEPKRITHIVFTADAFFALGEAQKATDLYQKATAAVDDNAIPYYRSLKAYALARLGRAAEAEEILADVLRQAPDDINVAYQAALTYSILGNKDAAWQQRYRAEERGFRECWFQAPWWALQ